MTKEDRFVATVAAAAIAGALFAATAHAMPATDVNVHPDQKATATARYDPTSVVHSPETGFANASRPAAVTAFQTTNERPVVAERPLTGREFAERRTATGLAAGR